MNCRAYVEFILQYLENDLPPDVRADFERHLAACPPCGRYLRQYQQTVDASRVAFRSAAPDLSAAPEELIQAILASRRPS
jgi:anti-sigma factor RsiW